MAKLWKCTLSFDVYVVADDEDDAIRTAADNARDELDNRDRNDVVDWVVEVKDPATLDRSWMDVDPYVADNLDVEDLTCSEFLERAAEEAAEKARKADLPGQQRFFEGT